MTILVIADDDDVARTMPDIGADVLVSRGGVADATAIAVSAQPG